MFEQPSRYKLGRRRRNSAPKALIRFTPNKKGNMTYKHHMEAQFGLHLQERDKMKGDKLVLMYEKQQHLEDLAEHLLLERRRVRYALKCAITSSTPTKGSTMKRRRMSRKKSRRSFSRGALRVNRKNTRGTPMRGGWRL